MDISIVGTRDFNVGEFEALRVAAKTLFRFNKLVFINDITAIIEFTVITESLPVVFIKFLCHGEMFARFSYSGGRLYRRERFDDPIGEWLVETETVNALGSFIAKKLESI